MQNKFGFMKFLGSLCYPFDSKTLIKTFFINVCTHFQSHLKEHMKKHSSKTLVMKTPDKLFCLSLQRIDQLYDVLA